jgi:hypothetical protein
MKNTSVSSQNPHAKSLPASPDTSESSTGCGEVELPNAIRWSNCLGCAVADDSKSILAVRVGSEEYIMADIRLLPDIKGTDRITLEFFFDGDTDGLQGKHPCGFERFLDSLQTTVEQGVQEYYKRRLTRAIGNKAEMKSLKTARYPDTSIVNIGATMKDAFRDAGCMLSFIAVRVTLSEDCAAAIGGIAFPEAFGMKDSSASDDPPVPKWLIGMGFATFVVALGTVYAWANILLYGNSLS